MPVLPDDIRGFRSFYELNSLSKQLLLCVILKRNNFSIFFIKGDKSGNRHGQGIKVLEQLVDYFILIPHLVKFLISNEGATLTQSQDQGLIFE